MKIAFAHFRVGETDGVSLEMDKWRHVLEEQGHECVYVAGSKGTVDAYIIDEMHYRGEVNEYFLQKCYREKDESISEETLKKEVFDYAKRIEDKLSDFIVNEKIDIVVPNNIWSLGWHLPSCIAFTNVAKKFKNVRFIGHNHDFYWERILYSNPTVSFVHDIFRDYYLPKGENITHCVINKIAQEEVFKRTGIEAIVVPNVFDFAQNTWKKDEYNADLKEKLSIKENDIVVLQATRIVERKAIEFAVETVGKMSEIKENFVGKVLYNGKVFDKESKIHFILAGINESKKYLETLESKIEKYDISYHYINDIVDHSRNTKEDGTKVYSLWDTYVISDLVTYPSILEGWGNQLLEAMFGKLPVLVFEYPVFEKDLKQSNIEYISLGNSYSGEQGDLSIPESIVNNAAEKSLEVLFNKESYETQTERNFEIGKENYSYQKLEEILIKVFEL